MRALFLLGTLLLTAGSVKAQSNEAQFYYWNGVTYSAGNILCGLVRGGKLEKGWARSMMSGIVQSYSKDPGLTEFMPAINQGYRTVKDECPDVYQ